MHNFAPLSKRSALLELLPVQRPFYPFYLVDKVLFLLVEMLYVTFLTTQVLLTGSGDWATTPDVNDNKYIPN